MEIDELRREIDEIDDEIVRLYLQRTQTAKRIGEEKKKTGKAVFDGERERKIITRLTDEIPEEMQPQIKNLYETMFAMSRSVQNRLLYTDGKIHDTVRVALEKTPKEFPAKAVVACQGVAGAYAQIACNRLFAVPDILYFSSWDKVFSAVEQGMCQYGVLPIENSCYGSVTQVYDLMKKHRFHIVRSLRLRVEHCLLAKHGTNLSDIREIFTHEQAAGQCSLFLDGLPDVKVTVCANTAEAARTVAQSQRTDAAAIASRECAELYMLSVLQRGIQNSPVNETRFICIAKDIQIFPGADRVSMMLCIPNKPGSLWRLLSQFAAIGVNLTKLESRPLPGSSFEFVFYFDFEASLYRDAVVDLLEELQTQTEQFVFLGGYSEL